MCHAVNPSLVAFGILPFATLVHPCTAEARRPHPCGRRAHKATPPRHVQGEYDKVELMLVTMQCCCRRLCQRMAAVALIEVREYAMDGISVSGRRMSVPVFPPQLPQWTTVLAVALASLFAMARWNSVRWLWLPLGWAWAAGSALWHEPARLPAQYLGTTLEATIVVETPAGTKARDHPLCCACSDSRPGPGSGAAGATLMA